MEWSTALRPEAKEKILSRISLKLSSRKLYWMREAIDWRLKGYPRRPRVTATQRLEAALRASSSAGNLDDLVNTVADNLKRQDGSGSGMVEAKPTSRSKSDTIAERSAIRQGVVNPILQRKRWKPGSLATKAGVGKNSVYQYLDGTRTKITDENRDAIAQALDLTPEQLPD